MSFLAEIFAGGTEGVFKGVKDIIGTMKADPLELAKIESAMNQAELNMQLGLSQAQTKINEIEAASQDKFVSRWRPAVGWLCASGVGYVAVIQPLGAWISLNAGLLPPPPIEAAILIELLFGLLGLAGLRTYEKTKK